MDSKAAKRKITIQLGVCKRTQKEAKYYVKEVEENTAKVQLMKDEGKDIYDIRKQEEVLAESVMMIPDSQRRLDEAIKKLSDLLDEGSGIYDENDETIAEAKSLLREYFPVEPETKVSLADNFDESKEENF